MRRKFVYYVLFPFVVFALVAYLFADRWVEAGLEAAGERAVGARVEIDGLRISLSPLGIAWARLQVADPHDPWRNTVETGPVRFALDPGQLLRGKYIIETMEVNELILGTRRTTDGSLPVAKAMSASRDSGSTFSAQAQGALSRTTEKTPVTGIDALKGGINIDSLVNALDIRTLRHLDSVKQQVFAASQQWNAAIAEFQTSRKRLGEIEAGVKSINPSQLKDLPAITSAISTVDNAVKGINEISSGFSARKASIEGDVRTLTASVHATERIAADDLRRLASMARLPNLNTTGVARMLIGEEMYARAMSYLHWVDFARMHVKNSQTKPDFETPARMRGQTIRFPVEHAYPKYWVRRVLISGGTDSAGTGEFIRAKGELRDITEDQRMTQVPMTASLQGVEGGGRTFSLQASIDRTKEVPEDQYAATLTGVPLASFGIGSAEFLSGAITNARMNSVVRVTVPGNRFDAHSTITLSRFTMRFGREPASILERIVREVLEGITSFDVGLRLWNTGDGFDVALSTDLDTQIAGRVQEVLGAEFAKLQKTLKAGLDTRIAERRAEVEQLVAGRKAEIENEIAGVQAIINENAAMVDARKKELTDRLEGEKRGKVNDLLKGILKK